MFDPFFTAALNGVLITAQVIVFMTNMIHVLSTTSHNTAKAINYVDYVSSVFEEPKNFCLASCPLAEILADKREHERFIDNFIHYVLTPRLKTLHRVPLILQEPKMLVCQAVAFAKVSTD